MIKSFLIITTITFLFTACGPNLKTIGTVDETKMVTAQELAELGAEGITEKYLGKVITVTGLELINAQGRMVTTGDTNICDPSYRYTEESYPQKQNNIPQIILSPYFNYEEYMLQDIKRMNTETGYETGEIQRGLRLDLDVCSLEKPKDLIFDRNTDQNIQNSPELAISGYVYSALMNRSKTDIYIFIIPTGLLY